MEQNVITDMENIKIPLLSAEARRELNAQTAYNRTRLEECSLCGCFHCGSMFSVADIAEWLSEDDGDDTALCPCCGVDAVIKGTAEFPLSTALLAKLYLSWFSEEHKARCTSATYAPSFSSSDDYLRKGIPFLLKERANAQIVGEIIPFPDRILQDCWGDLSNNDIFAAAMTTINDESHGGVVKAKAYFDDEGYYHSDFTDEYGDLLPIAPWNDKQQDLLLELSKTHGEALHGVITLPGAPKMTLFVAETDDDAQKS